MKISTAMPVLDLGPPASSAPASAAAAGQGFETAVRAVAERANDRGNPPPSDKEPAPAPPPERDRVADGRKAPAAPQKATSSKDNEDRPKDEDGSAEAPVATPTADLLGLLAGTGAVLGQAGGQGKDGSGAEGEAMLSVLSTADAAALAAAAAAASDGTTFDGALEERLVITPLGAGSAEGKAAGAAKDRTGVGLEVLHMETHFEPRVDDVVLVEAAADPAAGGTTGADDVLGGILSSIRMAGAKGKDATEAAGNDNSVSSRFDETLARLSTGEGTSDAEGGASGGRGGKDRRADAASGDDKAQTASRSRTETVVDVETSDSLPVAGSMTSQIADRIVDAFRPSSGQERIADPAPGSTHLRMTAGGAALKTLTIQLQPENLGKLEVSMRLVEGRLTLELAASSAETAHALAQDRAGLKKLLEHAGFSMDEASIAIVARDSTAATAKSGAGQDAGGQGQQASSGSDRGGSQASGSERGFSRESQSDARDSAPGRRGRGEGETEGAVRQRTSVFL